MDVFITGSRGSQQSPVLEHLVRRGHQVSALSRTAGPQKEGVRWVRGNLSDIAAFQGRVQRADALVFHRPISAAPWPVEPLLLAANAWGVERIVFNASGAVPPPGTDGDARQVVNALAGAQAAVTVLQPTLYLENLLLPFILEGLRDGVLRYPLPATGFGVRWVATQDLGALTATALENGVEGQFNVGGPEALDGGALAAAIGRGLGRSIRFEAAEPAAFAAKLKPLVGHDAAAGVEGLYTGIAQAPDSFVPWLAPSVSPLWSALSTEPTSVETWSASVVRPLVSEVAREPGRRLAGNQ